WLASSQTLKASRAVNEMRCPLRCSSRMTGIKKGTWGVLSRSIQMLAEGKAFTTKTKRGKQEWRLIERRLLACDDQSLPCLEFLMKPFWNIGFCLVQNG